MKVFMVRHGQTDSNAAKKIMGQHVDEPLNEEGERQAAGLAQSIRMMPFDVIFSSPMKRAADTARIIANGRSIPIELREELKERDFGSLTGKTYEEAARVAGQESKGFKAADRAQEYDYRPFGGESGAQVKERFLKCIGEIKSAYADKRVLIVAHAGILRLAHLLFKELNVDHIDNVSIEEFDV